MERSGMANTIPNGSYPVSGTASGTTAQISVVLGGTTNVGRSVYLTGLTYQSTGATTPTNINIVVSYTPISGSGIVVGTWTYPTGSAVTTFGVPLDINLIPPMQSMQPITGASNSTTLTPVGSFNIVASAAGAGATGAILNAWGYLQ
jgi:hypothetical protein